MLCACLIPFNRLTVVVATLSPNHAIVIATFGLCLIFLEFNRPGRILPGASGLALLLLATASMLHHPLQPVAVALDAGIEGRPFPHVERA